MSKSIKVTVNLTLRGGLGHERRVPIHFDSGTNVVELRDGAVIDIIADAWLDFGEPVVSPHTVRYPEK